MVGWKIVYSASIPCVLFVGQEVRSFHNTAVDYSAGRTAECARWNLCTKSGVVAWHEDSESQSHAILVHKRIIFINRSYN